MLTMLQMAADHARGLLAKVRSERGAGLAEYVLLVGFIAVMIIGVVIAFRTVLSGAITRAGDELSNFK